MISLADIEAAQQRISDSIYRTPFSRSEHFPESGCSALWLKYENEQRTGAFKERGALNKMLTLTAEQKANGIIAASAGNHSQGVAYHAGRLGIKATIVMPERTPLIKVSKTRGYGATVVLKGASFDEAYDEALKIQQEQHLAFVHPFNDRDVIAGQGTIGLEMLEQYPYVEVVIVPVGGGGLISGIAVALKENNPRIQVIGVQPAAIPSMKASFDSKKLTNLPGAITIADGLAVKKPGDVTFGIIQKYVDEIVTVEEEEIANAILLLLEREKTVVEGAGAVGIAALVNEKIPKARGKKTGVVLAGGNIDVNLISRIIERGLVKDGRLVKLIVKVADRPGMLAKLVSTLADGGANVVEIYHQRAFSKVALGEAHVEVTLETRGKSHVEELIKTLQEKAWQVEQEF